MPLLTYSSHSPNTHTQLNKKMRRKICTLSLQMHICIKLDFKINPTHTNTPILSFSDDDGVAVLHTFMKFCMCCMYLHTLLVICRDAYIKLESGRLNEIQIPSCESKIALTGVLITLTNAHIKQINQS